MTYWQLRKEILMSIDQHVKDMGALITKARVASEEELVNELANIANAIDLMADEVLRYADLILYQRVVKKLNGQPCPKQGDNNGK